MSAQIGSDLWREQQQDAAPTTMDDLYATIAAALCLSVERVDFDIAWDFSQGAAEEGAACGWPRWPNDYLRRMAPAVSAIGSYTIYGGGRRARHADVSARWSARSRWTRTGATGCSGNAARRAATPGAKGSCRSSRDCWCGDEHRRHRQVAGGCGAATRTTEAHDAD